MAFRLQVELSPTVRARIMLLKPGGRTVGANNVPAWKAKGFFMLVLGAAVDIAEALGTHKAFVFVFGLAGGGVVYLKNLDEIFRLLLARLWNSIRDDRGTHFVVIDMCKGEDWL